MSKAARRADIDQSDRDYIARRQQRDRAIAAARYPNPFDVFTAADVAANRRAAK